jgi:hypothetical protein
MLRGSMPIGGGSVGWGERANRQRRTGYKAITSAQCATLGRDARQVLAELGLRLEPSWELERMIRGVEFLGSFAADPFEKGGAGYVDKQRAIGELG